jgi:hypothetical protein
MGVGETLMMGLIQALMMCKIRINPPVIRSNLFFFKRQPILFIFFLPILQGVNQTITQLFFLLLLPNKLNPLLLLLLILETSFQILSHHHTGVIIVVLLQHSVFINRDLGVLFGIILLLARAVTVL